MFTATFSSYAYQSTVGTIPASLFSSISTSSATNLSSTFASTFNNYAHQSTVGTIPASLLSFINLSSANINNVSSIFSSTFYGFAYANTTPSTDISAIWGTANLAGKITAANAGTVSGSTLSNTFRDVRSVTGSAQTFINNYLGGITPTSRALTFTNTSVTDLNTIDANWR
jgi:hypothetical protein